MSISRDAVTTLPGRHMLISSKFFIFQQESAPAHRALEAINFSL